MMTGRCHRVKKMMGRGADGGCGTEEKPCPISRVPAKIPAKIPASVEKVTPVKIDSLEQARKALCQRSPFDAEDASVSTAPTLPSGLATFLSRHSDSRKRHKKSHSGADTKSTSRPSRGSNIWTETEEYFRELTLPDIDNLFEVSAFPSLAARGCFSIPSVENALVSSAGCTNVTSTGFGLDNEVRAKVGKAFASSADCSNATSDVYGSGIVVNNGIVAKAEEKEVVKEEEKEVVKEEMKEDGHFMEIDSTGADVILHEEKDCPSLHPPASSSSLAWILGVRNKILLTTERPSKKRKLLGEAAGLEKVLVTCPCEGNSSLCHFCCQGNTDEQLNPLIVCSSCNVAVHRKCYGVQDDVVESWLCSWCRHRNDMEFPGKGSSINKPCVLCSKQDGALKPVQKVAVERENGAPLEFAHLFCCQWMPEVYVEDSRMMEPIMNVDGIKETRRKLVCNVCKVKCGACVRCSHGSCRTSFHPICAREARHRMEIWAKFGCDNVELRAFCSKHSEVEDSSSIQHLGHPPLAAGSNSSVTKHLPVTLSANKPHKLKISCKNGDKTAVHIETTSSDKLCDNELLEIGLVDTGSNANVKSEPGDAQQLTNLMTLESSEDVTPSDSLNFAPVLKKLIDRGKVNVKDVALEIGISPDLLAATLVDDHLVPDLRCKIVKWLKSHAYVCNLQKNLKVKIKPTSETDIGAADGFDAVSIPESDISDSVPVKSVPPRRRTKSNIRILKDNKILCSTNDTQRDDGMVVDEVKTDQLVNGTRNDKESIITAPEEITVDPAGLEDSLTGHLHKSEGEPYKHSNYGLSKGGQAEDAGICERNISAISNQEIPVCSVDPNIMIAKGASGSYIHPFIQRELTQMQALKDTISEFDGSREREISPMEASSSAGICCNHKNQHSACINSICKYDGVKFEQLIKAKDMGVLEMSPEDELEGELIYFQHRLLGNAITRKHQSDDLISKVVKSVPQEIDVARNQRWDAVLVNQYLCELREARKQGRKERRHKEAQAVLAAATAAAAASSRISSFRKDTLDESGHQENLLKVNLSSGRAGIHSQLMPRAKETLSRVAVSRISSEKQSDFSKEHPRSCDICRRPETLLNAIIICSSCKVAVHLDCYRRARDSTGPWHCELCEDLSSSRCSRAPSVNSWEKPYFIAECGICGGTTGAFRKSTDGQWIHAFCAEWVFESTFRRGQVHPVEGMETVSKGTDVCCVCRHRKGVCIKCNYGHCQSTFHPSCARSAGFYMNARNGGGKFQHKAYCEKHSSEQRAKAETQKHGFEELKSIKQIRVELERLRLLCERIIKREKLKRELVLCSHDILASKRDTVALSVLFRSPFFPPDVSSESATTSLKAHTDGYKSCSEAAIQRSDDITVDSTVCVNHNMKQLPGSMEIDQKTDDSSTSHIFTRKPTEKMPFSGKQIPHRTSSVASQNLSDDAEKRAKARKHTETFEKELIMTSDQASMKNQRLPKGFVYVPIGVLSDDKQINNQDPCSRDG